MQQKSRPYDIREADITEDKLENFILSGWLRSYHFHCVFFRMGLPSHLFFQNYRPVVRQILSISKILVASALDNSNDYYGFCVYRLIGDIPVISYLYIKNTFTGQGIGKALIQTVLSKTDKPGGFITHNFPWLATQVKNHQLVYQPFLDLKLISQTDQLEGLSNANKTMDA